MNDTPASESPKVVTSKGIGSSALLGSVSFHVSVLEAQGVPPSLARHIVEMVEQLEIDKARLREALGRIVNDLQGLAYAEYGNIGMAADYAPSLPDALSLLPNS